jgi:hypothetical protein
MLTPFALRDTRARLRSVTKLTLGSMCLRLATLVTIGLPGRSWRLA